MYFVVKIIIRNTFIKSNKVYVQVMNTRNMFLLSHLKIKSLEYHMHGTYHPQLKRSTCVTRMLFSCYMDVTFVLLF